MHVVCGLAHCSFGKSRTTTSTQNLGTPTWCPQVANPIAGRALVVQTQFAPGGESEPAAFPSRKRCSYCALFICIVLAIYIRPVFIVDIIKAGFVYDTPRLVSLAFIIVRTHCFRPYVPGPSLCSKAHSFCADGAATSTGLYSHLVL